MAVQLKDIPVNVGICITAREIFGRLTGFRECAEILSRFSFQNVAFRLAFVRQSIDSFFGNEPLQSIQHLKLYRRVLGLVLSSTRANDAVTQAAALYKKEPVHAFADQAVAATLELAARYCPREGGKEISTPDDHDDLGRVLFSFHDSMFSPRFVPKAAAVNDCEKVPDEMMFEVVRNYIANNYLGNLGNGVARISAFISADINNRRRSHSRNARDSFNVAPWSL